MRGVLMEGEKALEELRRSDATKNFIVVMVNSDAVRDDTDTMDDDVK